VFEQDLQGTFSSFSKCTQVPSPAMTYLFRGCKFVHLGTHNIWYGRATVCCWPEASPTRWFCCHLYI